MAEILVVDTETTSLDTTTAEILEIAVAQVDTESRTVVMLLDTLISPMSEGWETCWFMKHSGLSPVDFKNAPLLTSLQNLLNELFSQYPVTSYNLAYDRPVLERNGFKIPVCSPCLMESCIPVLHIPSPRGWGYKWPSLAQSWQHFRPGEVFNAHRAGGDCRAAADILLALQSPIAQVVN